MSRKNTELKQQTPYYDFSVVWRILSLYWLGLIVVSVSIWRWMNAPDSLVVLSSKLDLSVLYPAIGKELSEYAKVGDNRSRYDMLSVVFSLQFFSLVVTVIVDLSVRYSRLNESAPDGLKVHVVFFLCVVAMYFMGGLGSNPLDIYNDFIDNAGFFIIKRTIMTACLSYTLSSSVLNAIVYFRGR